MWIWFWGFKSGLKMATRSAYWGQPHVTVWFKKKKMPYVQEAFANCLLWSRHCYGYNGCKDD